MIEFAKQTVRALYAEAASVEDEATRTSLAKWARYSEKQCEIMAMVNLARSDRSVVIDPDQLDSDPYLFNVQNGTLDLRTGQLRQHEPADLITKLTPVEYDIAAGCPGFDRFLERVLPAEEDRRFVQVALGYSMLGITTEHVLVFLLGEGANGKSTLMRTVQAVFGEYGRQGDPELLMAKDWSAHPTGIADLQGARLVVCSEVEQGRKLAEVVVKQLTGGDTMKARYMRQDFFEFEPTHTIWLSTNHKPVIKGTDHAIWRRIRLVPFGVTIPKAEQNHHLEEQLRSELQGILRWVAEGCLAYQQGGLVDTTAVLEATDGYRAEMDRIATFIDEECLVAEVAYVMATDLYSKYQEWSKANGEAPKSQPAFGRSLTERGWTRVEHPKNRRKMYVGIGLLNEARNDLTSTSKRFDSKSSSPALDIFS